MNEQLLLTWQECGCPIVSGQFVLKNYAAPFYLDDSIFEQWKSIDFRGRCEFTYIAAITDPVGDWQAVGLV